MSLVKLEKNKAEAERQKEPMKQTIKKKLIDFAISTDVGFKGLVFKVYFCF